MTRIGFDLIVDLALKIHAVISSGVSSWTEAAFTKCCSGVFVQTSNTSRDDLKGQEGNCTCSFSAPDLELVSSEEGQISCLSPYKINFVEELVPFFSFGCSCPFIFFGLFVCMSCSLILSSACSLQFVGSSVLYSARINL